MTQDVKREKLKNIDNQVKFYNEMIKHKEKERASPYEIEQLKKALAHLLEYRKSIE